MSYKKTIFGVSFIVILLSICFLCGCSEDNPSHHPESEPIILSNIDSFYTVLVDQEVVIKPKVTTNADKPANFRWEINNKTVSTDSVFRFVSSTPDTVQLKLSVYSEEQHISKNITIYVLSNKEITFKTSAYSVIELEVPAHFSHASGSWRVLEAPQGSLHRLVNAHSLVPAFIANTPGTYTLSLLLEEMQIPVKIEVEATENAPTPYISDVFDYYPAPGQFVNKMPKYTDGDDKETMLNKVKASIVGDDTEMVTLGGWGGYVTFGFDHTIINAEGLCDFRVIGNAFESDALPNNMPYGGSSEPGVVMVAYDKNKNGKPDEDEWYEIKGSSSFSSDSEPWIQRAKQVGNQVQTIRDYTITYYKPQSEVNDGSSSLQYVSIQNYIKWKDNQNQQGYLFKNVYHMQSYYPQWIQADSMLFSGIRLPQNGINEYAFNPTVNQVGMSYVLYGFRYGYADNYPNNHKKSAIDIDWAVDKAGNPANLPGIDFVKVYTGVFQECGWLGEVSTEVERAEDLHLSGHVISSAEASE